LEKPCIWKRLAWEAATPRDSLTPDWTLTTTSISLYIVCLLICASFSSKDWKEFELLQWSTYGCWHFSISTSSLTGRCSTKQQYLQLHGQVKKGTNSAVRVILFREVDTLIYYRHEGCQDYQGCSCVTVASPSHQFCKTNSPCQERDCSRKVSHISKESNHHGL
jgi:hypothetical protein